jgi:hypothetical protein
MTELIISLKQLIKISNISKITIYKGKEGYIATLRLFKNIENKISL